MQTGPVLRIRKISNVHDCRSHMSVALTFAFTPQVMFTESNYTKLISLITIRYRFQQVIKITQLTGSVTRLHKLNSIIIARNFKIMFSQLFGRYF